MNDEEEGIEREKRKRSKPKQKTTNFNRFGRINLAKYFAYEVNSLKFKDFLYKYLLNFP